jgi:integral membrane protein
MLKNIFLWVGVFEGISLLLLFGFAMPMKYMAGDPSWVRQVGMAHGLLFVLYISLSVVMFSEDSWSKRKWWFAFILASVPFGTFYFERKILSNRQF